MGVFEVKAKDGSTFYRVQIRMKGQPQESRNFKRKTDANRWHTQTKAAILEGRHFKTTEARKHTLADLLNRYIRDVLSRKAKSQKKQVSKLLWWRDKLGHVFLNDLTPPLIVQCRDELLNGTTPRGTPRAPATCVRYMAALSHALSIAVREWHWLDDSPMRKVSKPKEPRGRVRFLDEDERKRLLEACKASNHPYIYAVVVLALSTGMRQAEIMSLRWSDVDLQNGKATLHDTKNGDPRVVPIARLALELMRKLQAAPPLLSELVFPSIRDPSKPIEIRFAWQKVVTDAVIRDFRFHDLRHSAASYLAMNGASPSEIAAVLGHKTLQMVKRYAHIGQAHTASVVESMNEKIFG
jgi:integrase